MSTDPRPFQPHAPAFDRRPIPTVPPWRVLSICQPWASLIVDGFKPVEVRSWATPYRGTMLVHASSSRRWLSAEIRQWILDIAYKSYAKTPALAAWVNANWPTTREFKPAMSAIMGHCQITACHEPDAVPFDDLTPWHDQESYNWALALPVAIAGKPIACAGKLNLWKPPADLAVCIRQAFPDLP